MIKVNNQKAIRNIAKKSFQANKTRNIIAVIAIVLTTMLFTSLFTMGIGSIESFQQATMRQAGGDGHGVLKYLSDEQFQAVKDHPSIKEIAYNKILSDGVLNEEFLKRRAEFWYYDEVGLKLGFIKLEEGNMPQAENEVITDSQTLQLLGVPLALGSKIKLELTIRGETVEREFVLSGYWTSDPAFNVGQIFSSRAYVDAHAEELQSTYYEDSYMTGSISAYIMFGNSMNLEEKLGTLITDSGFSLTEGDENYIANNVNWSYLSTNFGMDPGTILGLGCGLLLIVFTGYLIIYNIFQISIVRDIRFYGLLKTIGTTAGQIRRIIRRQAMLLSVIGIPIGLFVGFFSGKALVPLLMSTSSYAGSAVSVSPSPVIFVGSALFALFTVFISTLKPGRLAGKVSPIEAVRYTESDQPKHGRKKSVNGAKMTRMALSNVGRNKKRTVLVVISLSLSIVLLNTVLTLSDSIDMNKFYSKFTDTDFLIAHADYFNYNYSGKDNETSEQFIQTAQSLDGFEEGGRLYGGRDNAVFVTDPKNTQTHNRNDVGDLAGALYGLEDLPMRRLQLVAGEIDMEKLLSGDYILEGVYLDDNERPILESTNFDVGETVELHHYVGTADGIKEREYVSKSYTVLGHVAIKSYTNCDRTGWDYTFYLPAEAYKNVIEEPAVMSYAFNVADDKEEAVELFLEKYTTGVEIVMNYDSKATAVSSFEGLKYTLLLVGSALGGIIGFIGILNFINAVLTSIVARKKEFAMLESIGMTRSQLRQMLCFEGVYYAGFAGLFSLVFGMLCSFVVVKAICNQMWFMSYQVIVWPLYAAVVILFLIGLIVPLVVYGATDKQSIVEKLREVS